MFMNILNQDMKKKLINTLSQYAHKVNQLQQEINSLKDIINQLIINPTNSNPELKEILTLFSDDLNKELVLPELENKVNVLSDVLQNAKQKEKSQQQIIINLLKIGSDSIKQLAHKSQDKEAIEQFQSFLNSENDNKDLLIQFNAVISQCVASVVEALDELSQMKTTGDDAVNPISVKVNNGLYQLINHLSIPQDLEGKKEQIKLGLEKKLNGEELSTIIDEITNLVIDSFNVEQTRFKKFLQQLTDQLHDFDMYLKSSTEVHHQAAVTRDELESGIRENINQIKTHLDNSQSIEELSEKVSQHFEVISTRLKEYHESEKKREFEYEHLVQGLKEKLIESEKIAEEVKNLLSFQKYKMNHDSLTGLPNRESYEEHIHEAFLRWRRSSKELSVAIGDIDHFKQINDNFGHHAGDKVLKKIGLIFRSSIRGVDFIARIGGEEFIFIFEQTPHQSAVLILEKLRKLVQDCEFYYRDNKVDVTVSFGLTTIKEKDDIESLFIRADKALYKAKSGGRNRIDVL